jgi:hypothetical protein
MALWTFLGPNGTRFPRCHFRFLKSQDFQGPSLPMALVMDFFRIKIITYIPAPYKQPKPTLIVLKNLAVLQLCDSKEVFGFRNLWNEIP